MRKNCSVGRGRGGSKTNIFYLSHVFYKNTDHEKSSSVPLEVVQDHFVRYLDTYEEDTQAMLATGEIRVSTQRRATPEEIREAHEIIRAFIAAGERPRVTVPRVYADTLRKEGLTPHATAYQKDIKFTVGTIGVPPFLPPGEDRVIVELDIPAEVVQPRFTGTQNAFQGVVVIARSVSPKEIRILE